MRPENDRKAFTASPLDLHNNRHQHQGCTQNIERLVIATQADSICICQGQTTRNSRIQVYYNRRDVKYNGQRLYGHEIKINSDVKRGDGDFDFSLAGWTLIHNTIASFGNPYGKGGIFDMSGDAFPSGRGCAAEFAWNMVSDSNTFSKDPSDNDYFPGRNVMYALTATGPSPNVDLPTWQAVANAHGRQDLHSRFVYPIDTATIADPTTPPSTGAAIHSVVGSRAPAVRGSAVLRVTAGHPKLSYTQTGGIQNTRVFDIHGRCR